MAITNGSSPHIDGLGPIICPSLYADDETIFIAPFEEDFKAFDEGS
jgi:hypothetical protein